MQLGSVEVPDVFYGTAWKEDATEGLVRTAHALGFRAFDTANQRKHYDEVAVGQALREVPRETLFLQSKFTSVDGQDERLPYDPEAPVREQVRQSFESTLEHFGTTWMDSYLLHGPTHREGLTEEDWDAWRGIEDVFLAGKVRQIGVSNVSRGQLDLLIREARVRPSWVQNRCYARTSWDLSVRQLCAAHGMIYQGFSLLTANRGVWAHAEVANIARSKNVTAAAVVLRFAHDLGMVVLTGTTSPDHMRDDLSLGSFTLSNGERAKIAALR